MDGRILRGVGGFYFIRTGEGEIYSCRAAGIFRRLRLKPVPGDYVSFSVTDPKDLEGNIERIYERKNLILRPAAANVDQALVVCALRDPDPSTDLLDRFLISAAQRDITAVIFFSKADLVTDSEAEKYCDIYRRAGYKVISGSSFDESSLAKIREALLQKTTFLAGPSGVGKSSLLNKLCGYAAMEVGELSGKIRRGRQTTRHTELFCIGEGSYLLDTPGFGALDLEDIVSGDLASYFHEFDEFVPGCRFALCSHVGEGIDVCAVKRAVRDGEISPSRYESYVRIYLELKDKEL